MRVFSGFLLLLLSLHSLQGQGLDLGLESGSCDEQVAQALRQKVPDTFELNGPLRDIVLKLKVQVESMEARVKESEVKVNDMRVELAVTKVHVELLQKDKAGETLLRRHFQSASVVE